MGWTSFPSKFCCVQKANLLPRQRKPNIFTVNSQNTWHRYTKKGRLVKGVCNETNTSGLCQCTFSINPLASGNKSNRLKGVFSYGLRVGSHFSGWLPGRLRRYDPPILRDRKNTCLPRRCGMGGSRQVIRCVGITPPFGLSAVIGRDQRQIWWNGYPPWN